MIDKGCKVHCWRRQCWHYSLGNAIKGAIGAVQKWNTQAGDRGSNSCYVRFGSGVLIVPNMRQP